MNKKRVSDLEKKVFSNQPRFPRALFQRDGKLYVSLPDGEPLTEEEVKEWLNQRNVVRICFDDSELSYGQGL